METANIDAQALRDTLDAIQDRHYNQLLGNPGIAPGSDVDKIKITNAFHYRLNGIEYYKAATDDVIAPATQGAGVFKKVVVGIDAAGTVTLTAGTTAATQLLAAIPTVASTILPIAYLEIPENFTSETTDVTTDMIKRFTSTIDVTYT